MQRRQFLHLTGLGLAAGLIGSKVNAQSRPGETCTQPLVGVIARNHGHILYIPNEDAELGQPKRYSIQGSSGHPHFVDISAEQFVQLKTVGRLELISSTDVGHAHAVVVSLT